MRSICEGIVIGVSSGLVLSILLGVFGWLRHLYLRSKQLRYIQTVIIKGKCDTHKEGKPTGRVGKAYFDAMCREVRWALQWQSSDLSYDQRAAFHNLFSRILNPPDSATDGTITDDKIDTCFGMLEDASFKFWVFRNPGGKSGSPGDTDGVEIKAAEMKVDGVAESLAVAEAAR